MDIPSISIPEIKIDLPVYNPYQVLNVPLPSLMMPGCVRYHRDASPKNTALYNDDPRGTYITCPYGSMPTFEPLLYDKTKIQITTTNNETTNTEQDEIQAEPTTPNIPKKEDEVVLKPCPPKNALRIGSFVNEKKLERIKNYIREEDGECLTVYEKVDFKDQYIPEFSTVVSTFFIASVAATTPIILNAIKPLTKQLIKRLSKSKDKTNQD